MSCIIEEQKRRANIDAMLKIAQCCAEIQRKKWVVYKCAVGTFTYGHCSLDSFKDSYGYIVKTVDFPDNPSYSVREDR